MARADVKEVLADLKTAMDKSAEVYADPHFTGLRVRPSDLLTIMHYLRDQVGMNYLANLTATDLNEEFEIVYHLYSIPDNGLKISVKTSCPRDLPQIPSIFSIYPTADWQEREVFDLMGVTFSGHPNLVRVLLPDDFSGHPLRKDFRKEA
jgi:NADH-quinone oxidoreductase subunit C